MSVHEERVKRIATAFNADSGNARLQLGDTTGGTQFSTFDSAGKETFIVKSDGTLSVVGNANFGSQGTFSGNVLPSSGNSFSLGTDTAPWSEIYGSDLHVGNLVAENKIATIGGRIVVSPSTKLIANVSLAATTIDVQHNSISSGDRIYLESAGKLEWMAVTSGPTTITGGYRYSVTRNLNGGAAQVWASGDSIVNTGVTGQGFIDLYSRYGIPASGQSSTSRQGPTITGNVRTGTTWNDIKERWAVGNLKGLFDYGSAVYGLAAGDPAATWISADATNGVRLMNGSTNLGQWSAAGGITIGEVASLKSNVVISSGSLAIRNNLTERVKLTSGGTLSINDSGGNAVFTFDSAAGAEFTKPLALGSGGGIYQGSGSFASPATGLKIWNPTGTASGGGKIAGFSDGYEQWYASTDGKFYAAGGRFVLDKDGVTLVPSAGRFTGSEIKWGSAVSMGTYIGSSSSSSYFYLDSTGGPASIALTASGITTNTIPNFGSAGVISLTAKSDAGGNHVLTLNSSGDHTITGNLGFKGSTSGTAKLQAAAAASTPTLTLPTSTGTLALISDVTAAVSGTSGKIAKVTGANTVGDSLMTESASNITVAGSLTLDNGSSQPKLQAGAVAGAPTITLPTTTGTLALLSTVYYVTCTTADVTVTLPNAALNANNTVIVKKIDATAFKVRAKVSAPDELDGQVGKFVADRWAAFGVRSDGVFWNLIFTNGYTVSDIKDSGALWALNWFGAGNGFPGSQRRKLRAYGRGALYLHGQSFGGL